MYNPDGSLDADIGNCGKVITHFTGTANSIRGMTLQLEAKFVAAEFNKPDTCSANFQLVRFKSNGSIESAFGTDGVVTLNISDFYSVAESVLLLPDSKILICGYSENALNKSVTIFLRLNTDSTHDSGFGNQGIAKYPDSNRISAAT